MKIRLMTKVTGCLVAVALVTCLFNVSVTVASPLQTAQSATTSVRTETKLVSNTPTFARHSSYKAIETPVAPSTKDAKKHDKKAIGRCWNRLMVMVREARQAHRNQN